MSKRIGRAYHRKDGRIKRNFFLLTHRSIGFELPTVRQDLKFLSALAHLGVLMRGIRGIKFR